MKFIHHFVSIMFIMLTTSTLTACGQKGKLVIPIKPPAISTPYPTAQPKEMKTELKPTTNTGVVSDPEPTTNNTN